MTILYTSVIISLCFLINRTDGAFDGMAACAWGSSRDDHYIDENALQYNLTNFSMSETDVKFLLYNVEHPYPFQLFIGDEGRLNTGNFDPKKLTKFIIHGYRSSDKSSSCVLPRNALLEKGDFNIITVDWNRAQYWGINHAFPSTYPAVVKKLGDVADVLVNMIKFLVNQGVNLSTTTIVGHSLGAHVAGIAGYRLGGELQQIVGLDPAAPYLSDKKPGERLSKESAKHVEVIHTEIENCGLKMQLGHYDFYPNSGKQQPGCDSYKCSHSRSYRFYAESINSMDGFYARACSDWQSMQEGRCDGEVVMMGGLDVKSIPEGIYYVKTNEEPPYAQGNNNLLLK